MDVELEEMLAKLKVLLKEGRTAGRQNYNGGVLFWNLAQSRTRESISEPKGVHR